MGFDQGFFKGDRVVGRVVEVDKVLRSKLDSQTSPPLAHTPLLPSLMPNYNN